MLRYSRGAELAKLADNLFSRTGTVVAYAPRALFWAGLGLGVAANTAAWTYQNRALPVVPNRTSPSARASPGAGIASRAGRGVDGELPCLAGQHRCCRARDHTDPRVDRPAR